MTSRHPQKFAQLALKSSNVTGYVDRHKFDTAQLRDAATRVANRAVCRYNWPTRPNLMYQQFVPAKPRFEAQSINGYGTAIVAGHVRMASGIPLNFIVPVPVRGGEACLPGVFKVGTRSYVLAGPGVSQAIADNDVRDLSANFDSVELFGSPENKDAPAIRSLIDLGGIGDFK